MPIHIVILLRVVVLEMHPTDNLQLCFIILDSFIFEYSKTRRLEEETFKILYLSVFAEDWKVGQWIGVYPSGPPFLLRGFEVTQFSL